MQKMKLEPFRSILPWPVRSYMRHVKAKLARFMGDRPTITCPVDVCITLHRSGQLPPLDNVVRCLLDGTQDIVLADNRQVVVIQAKVVQHKSPNNFVVMTVEERNKMDKQNTDSDQNVKFLEARRQETRRAAQILIEQIGAPGPEDIVETAERAAIEITQLRQALTTGLLPIVAMLADNPGTTKYLAPEVLQELRVFVDLARTRKWLKLPN